MTFIAGGNRLEVESARVCVLYDPIDGRIVHRHEAVNFTGARMVSDEELASRACALAAKIGHDVSMLRTLHFAADEYAEGKTYKVDIKTLRLNEIPRSSKGS